MKKQLSFALLTVSIFTLNALPGNAASNSKIDLDAVKTEASAITNGQWCVTVPYMGSLCWDL